MIDERAQAVTGQIVERRTLVIPAPAIGDSCTSDALVLLPSRYRYALAPARSNPPLLLLLLLHAIALVPRAVSYIHAPLRCRYDIDGPE